MFHRASASEKKHSPNPTAVSRSTRNNGELLENQIKKQKLKLSVLAGVKESTSKVLCTSKRLMTRTKGGPTFSSFLKKLRKNAQDGRRI